MQAATSKKPSGIDAAAHKTAESSVPMNIKEMIEAIAAKKNWPGPWRDATG